jgi:hypothetical protein
MPACSNACKTSGNALPLLYPQSRFWFIFGGWWQAGLL